MEGHFAKAERERLHAELGEARRQIDNFLTFGQGGASFQESQYLDRIATLEAQNWQLVKERDAAQEHLKRYRDDLIAAAESHAYLLKECNTLKEALSDLFRATAGTWAQVQTDGI